MAKKTYNILNYGKVYKQAFIELLSNTTTRVTLPDEIDGVQYSLGKERWKNDTNLQYINFNKCSIISEGICYDCTNLTSVIFSIGTTQIEQNAFYNCTKFLGDTTLPHTLTEVGQYAFYNAGSNYDRGTHTFAMINNEGIHTTIGSGAFNQSHLSEITAYLNNVGSYAFYNCPSLTKVDVEIHGEVKNYAFGSCQYVMDFRIDPNSVITSLGGGMFQYLGYETYSDPNFHMADFDFRNSTFKDLPGGVWTYCRFNGNVYLPSTLEKISGDFLASATGNWKFYFNYIHTVSSSSYLRSDSSNFTVKYLFPYELIEQASSTTNWSSHRSQMVGYGTGFEAGSTLPQYTRGSGVGITWYSDMEKTIVITTSSSATDIYYCSLGSARLVWYIDTPFLVDASVTISDGVNTYSAGDFVPVNTSLTIVPNYTDPAKNQLYLLSVNGTDYTSTGTASITMTQTLSIIVLYWNGTDSPFAPTLSDNSWMMIKIASQQNSIPSTWNIGNKKTLTCNGITYAARLVDKTGKYKRASDDSTAYLGFEVTELLPDSEIYNSSGSNNPSKSQLLIKMNSGTIWDNMDPDLKFALETVKVKVSQGGGSSTESTIIDWEGKLFLPREHDLFSTRNYSVPAEWDLITQDQYYQVGNIRNKGKINEPYYTTYLEMSPFTGATNRLCAIDRTGDATISFADWSGNVAIRFAL